MCTDHSRDGHHGLVRWPVQVADRLPNVAEILIASDALLRELFLGESNLNIQRFIGAD